MKIFPNLKASKLKTNINLNVKVKIISRTMFVTIKSTTESNKKLEYQYIVKRNYPGGKGPLDNPFRKILTQFPKPSINNQLPVVPINNKQPTNIPNATSNNNPITPLENEPTANSSVKDVVTQGFSRMVKGSFRGGSEAPPRHILTPDSPHVQDRKIIIATMCQYFFQLNEENILNDPEFLKYFGELLKDPAMISRDSQLGLEVGFSKRKFDQAEFEKLIEENSKISLIDLIGNNNGKMDTSTFFSFLQGRYLQNIMANKGKNPDVVIVGTPLYKYDISKLSQNISDMSKKMEKTTGNEICDILIDGIPYDFKLTIDMKYGKNHCYFFTTRDIEEGRKIAEYLTHVSNMAKIHNLLTLAQTLKDIRDNPRLTNTEKLDTIHETIFSNLEYYTTRMNLPLILMTPRLSPPTSAVVDEINKIKDVPVNKTLEPKHMLEILRRYSQTWSNETLSNTWKDTKGILGKEHNDNDKDLT